MSLDRSVNAPAVSPDLITKTVYYNGSDAVKEGEPFVYTTGAGTAGQYSGLRHNQVDRPKASGGIFAGVATRNYPACDPGNGRLIEIACPGSNGARIRVAATVAAGDVVQFCYKASTGSKIFKPAGSPHALTALQIGDAICRHALTVTSGTALVQADLPLAPYAAGQDE